MTWVVLGPDAALVDACRAEIEGADGVAAGFDELADVAAGRVEAGATHLAVVGSDRALHHVVAGALRAAPDHRLQVRLPDDPFVDPARPVRLVVAILPTEAGGFATSLGIPDDPISAIRHLRGDSVWGFLDVARVHLTSEAGSTADTVLVASALVDATTRPFGFRPRSVPQIDVTIWGRPPRPLDRPLGEERWRERQPFVAVANVQHAPGYGRIAPRAVPHDGLLDVVAGSGTARDARAWRRRMPRGEHVPDPSIRERLAERVVLRAAEPFAIAVDGERCDVVEAGFVVERTGIAIKI